jgi:branched-chain amino acid aminotransferase
MTGAPLVHWNGRIVPAEEAVVSVFDAGFLYGDGLYETMRAYHGRPFALDRHLARLAHAGERIDLPLPGTLVLRAAVGELLEATALSSAIVRITVTRGTLTRRLDLSSSVGPSVLVTANAYDPAQDLERRNGIRVILSRFVRLSASPLAGVKSTNYQVSLFARNEAREAGAAEVLLPNESGHIVEAAAANVFLVEGRSLVTPPVGAGILGGITREVVLEAAAAASLTVTEATLSRERLAAADEVFLSGTTIQVAPVVRIQDEPVANGRPGPVTLDLLDRYLAAVEKDTRG